MIRRFRSYVPRSSRFALVLILLHVLRSSLLAAQGGTPPSDLFSGTALNLCQWEDISQFGTVDQRDELVARTQADQTFSRSAVQTRFQLIGDFDVQVDYRLGDGWADPIPPTSNGPHIEVALVLYWDDSRYIQVARGKNAGGDFVNLYTSIASLGSHNAIAVPTSSLSGTLRIKRSGSTVTVMYLIGTTWRALDVLPAFSEPAYINLSAANVGLKRACTAYFDNFLVNSGETSYREYREPEAFRSRPDLIIGAAPTDYVALRVWGPDWKQVHPLDTLRQNGIDWVRVGVTTVSSPYLRDTPPEKWAKQPWDSSYWSALEYAEQMLRDASARGMRLQLYFYLSDVAANGGIQKAPPEWAGLSVSDTAARLEEYTYNTTKYFRDKGLNVEIYDIGNEIDFGILNFRPGERVPLPPGISPKDNIGYMRDNVWNLEATLLKSAIAGVKRAQSDAKIVLHIAGIGLGNLFAESFFRSMVDGGVEFDYAGLSHPSASFPWDLDKYSTACWFEHLQELAGYVGALGKKVIFCESTYPNNPQGQVAQPMRDFPFTPSGQAAWVAEQLRFVSNDPNIAGMYYWYPDAYPGLNGGRQPPDIPPVGLFASETQAQPAMAEYRVNLLKLTASASPAGAPLTVTFLCSHKGGSSVSYSWDYGDGSSSPLQNPVHKYASPGTYAWKVTLTDQGRKIFTSGDVTVARPETSSSFVPVVLALAGRNNSFYTSELTLLNRGTTEAALSYEYTAFSGGGSGKTTSSQVLGPGRQLVIPDVFEHLRQKGIPIPKTGDLGGTLRVTFQDVSSSASAFALVRTTTPVPPLAPIGRAGLAYAGASSVGLLSGPVFICGLRQTTTDRSNIALQNAGATADGDVTLRISVFDGGGSTSTPLATLDASLSPGGFVQPALPDLGAKGASFYARVERISGNAPYYAYGVINDNGTNDGSFIAPLPVGSVSGSRGITVPVVVESPPYATEVILTNTTTAQRQIHLTLAAGAIPGGTTSVDVLVGPGEQRIIPAFVAYLRDQGAPGMASASGSLVGPLFVTGNTDGIVASARTWNPDPSGVGRYGLFYSGMPFGFAATGSAWLFGLQQTAESRSNLAIVNTAEVDGGRDSFRIELFSGETGAKLGELTQGVDARGFVQLGRVLTLVPGSATNGFARVTRTSGNNPFITYAVVNDGANPGERSGDGAFIAMVPE